MVQEPSYQGLVQPKKGQNLKLMTLEEAMETMIRDLEDMVYEVAREDL